MPQTLSASNIMSTERIRMGAPHAPPLERLKRRSHRTESDCLEWDGHRNSYGYGRIGYKGRVDYCHRVAWEELVGPIPEGSQVHHRCGNSSCWNVEHLELLTHAENMAVERKDRCKHGHSLSGDNLYVSPSGHRSCRECNRAIQRRGRVNKRRSRQNGLASPRVLDFDSSPVPTLDDL